MGLTADIYDIFGFTNHVISEAAALQASITDVTTAVNHFAALLDNQSGATVVSMRNYITGFASSIQAIADAVNMAFTQILMVYQGAYALLDSDAYAVIDEDTISEVLNAYRNSYLWMDDELDIVKEMYYRVCGFTDVTMPSFENAFTRIEEFEAREREYRQALLDTEESFDANELVLLQNLTESSLTYLTGLMPQGYNAVTAPPNVKINGVTDISASLAEREQQIQDVWAHGFVAGANNTACLQITNNPELYNSILGIYGYMMQNEETINGLSEISRDTCETYITDAKWEEGWKKIATGAFALMSGAGALGVAICEAGTLLTVLGFASGGSSLLFGTSELFEGTQDVSISVQGLKYTDAINPLKDLMGEESYNKALAISTTTADVVCLAGAVKNTVKGIRDAKAAKGMPEEVPKIEKTDLAEIEKQADLEGVNITGGKGGTATNQKVFTDTPFDEAGNLKPDISYQTGEFKYNYETDATGSLDDLPSGRSGTASEMGGESGSKGGSSTQGYSNFADGMSPEDATRYISNNEKAFYNEFFERASGAGLSDTQIAEAFEAMRNGNYAKMATYFDTSSPIDGAVFWSGNKEGAAAYANSIGGTIMEQTPGGQVFDNWRGLGGMYPEWDTPTNLAQKPIWDSLSSQYANGAKGIATYAHPEGYAGKVWSNIEKPILEENDIIIQEVIIDAK